MWKEDQEKEISGRLDALAKKGKGKPAGRRDLHKDFHLIVGMIDSSERTALEQKLLSNLLKSEEFVLR
jgi:hypothetical protein